MRRTLAFALLLTVAAYTLRASGPEGKEGKDAILSSGGAAEMPVLSSFPTELTVNGLQSLAKGNYAIQLGAFNRRANAEALCDRIEELTSLAVDLIEEGDMFKVFLNSYLLGESICLYVPVSFGGEGRVMAEAPGSTSPKSANGAKDDNPAAASSNNKYPAAVSGNGNYPAAASGNALQDTAGVTNPGGEGVISVADERSAVAEGESGTTEGDTLKRSEESSGSKADTKKEFGLFRLRGNNPWLTKYDYFGKSVMLVNALIIVIIGSFATMIILLITILFNRRRMEREAALHQYLLEQYQTLIIDYLFGTSGPEPFRKIASDEYRRQVLVDQMIDVSVNLKGDTQEKLTRLYHDLDLVSDSLARAHSRRWHKKIKGFRELAFMGINEGNDEMVKALNSSNEILRMEAQIALVRLSDQDHFDFLSKLERPFSIWEQSNLHSLILQHDLPVPDFRKWLTSENPTVVMFALRMIREFRQKEAEAEVRKTLLHRDQRVSRLAVEVAGDLDMRSTLDNMKRMYKYQEYNNCLEIVKSMGKMPEPSMMGFLKLVLDKEDDVQLQIEAVKAIENMGEVGVQALVKVMKSEYKNYNIIVRHVLDRRIY